jgi:hypothetical protein
VSSLCGLQVTKAIADTGHAGERHIEPPPNINKHTGQRFAASTIAVNRVRAVINHVNSRACLLRRFEHFCVYRVQCNHVEQAALDTRLIGGHRHMKTCAIQSRNRLQRTRDRSPFVRGLDEAITVDVDDTVAVKDDEFQSGFCLVCQLGKISDFVHRIAQVTQQSQTISAHRFVFRHHHDFVEKFIDGGFEGREGLEVAREIALRE